jgi:uncharacterized protein (TIGR03435 family)
MGLMKKHRNPRRLAFCRGALLAFTVMIAASGAAFFAAQRMSAQAAPAAQAPAPAAAPATPPATTAATTPASPTTSPDDISGAWQATVNFPGAPHGVRMVVKITKAGETYNASLYNADQGSPPLAFTSVTKQGADVKISGSVLTIEGKLSADGKTIDGNVTGGPNAIPASFARATPDTAWAIPEAPKAMAADADPSLDVATIKPSDPSRHGKGFGFQGTHFRTFNMNLNDMIAIAYGVHPKQVIGAPDWFAVDLYDVDGVPDTPGRPNLKQMGILLQKLLADRCQLKLHHESRELSVYAITVAGGGPKMAISKAAPNDPQGFGFRGLGDLSVINMNMKDFAMGMQSAVTDKPVVDQTGLKDRYDFKLKWTPDDSQFAQFRTALPITPPKTDDPNAPPSLYTAIQEQIGLKIEATKAPDDVIVIDHVEKPSAN